MRFATLLLSSLATLQLGNCFVNVQSTGRSAQSTSLCATTVNASLKEKFSDLKALLPENMDVIKCGGYYNLQQLCENPKEELVKTIVDGIKSADKKVTLANDEKVEALATLLYAEGKGFEADLVDGEWAEVLTKQGAKSSSFQKAAEKGESKGKFPINTFNVDSMTFEADVKVLKKGRVYSKVKYAPSTDAYSKNQLGKIVLRRIGCDIDKATFKFWKLPTLNLFFLKRKGGFLEFMYMDNDIRITRGNRGGLFVHFRPEFLEAQLAQ